MDDWHHDWKTDIGLRLCGATSCGISYLAIHSLMALRFADGHLPQGALPFFLAAVGFLCASGGAVLLGLGHHIFDQVEISERWRTKPRAESHSAKLMGKADPKGPDDEHSSRFVINQDNTRVFDLVRRT
ncbi:hypothetical protein FHR20_001188 [Sphingomonas leidyi]|uniref:Uncharacterized protein n=1 Tax=Sphingomonas leidyi TaxID=68569 RepID=A0A7X5ZUN3_9SPHN|nr:hypothetical protein [Sphingomonas leidyi]NIJ64257.1 hypothetical protein [Sphingomonas leidyi]